MSKPKLATVWLESCAGCHMSFLDIDERIVGLLDKVEVTATPITDFKEIPFVDIGVIDGAIANEEEKHIALELRKKAKILIAWGDCAVFGGINTMRNFLPVKEVLEGAYLHTPSTVNPDGVIPQGEVPALLPKALPADNFVKVDVYVPGCPPDADTIYYVFQELLEGRMPKVPSDMMRYD